MNLDTVHWSNHCFGYCPCSATSKQTLQDKERLGSPLNMTASIILGHCRGTGSPRMSLESRHQAFLQWMLTERIVSEADVKRAIKEITSQGMPGLCFTNNAL